MRTFNDQLKVALSTISISNGDSKTLVNLTQSGRLALLVDQVDYD